MTKNIKSVLPVSRIENSIFMIRSEKVILDHDLAAMYGVQTRALVQAVKRNLDRFPEDFMFQLSKDEFNNLKSQIVTSSWGGRRTPPYAFIEQGIAMLSGVLKSKRAVLVNIEIMRTFVKLRRILATHDKLARKLAALERRYNKQFKQVFDAIREIMTPKTPPKQHQIGFHASE
jgi:hypothetical protein